MTRLRRLANDLDRLHFIKPRITGDSLILPINGENVLVSEDAENDRIVFWGEIAHGVGREVSAVDATLAYNERFAGDCAATLCASLEADCIILGRSMEPENFDAPRMMREATEFGAELAFARSFFHDEFARAQKERPREAPDFPATAEPVIKL
jgi:hypothetical protein